MSWAGISRSANILLELYKYYQIDGYSLTAQMKTIPELTDVPIIALTANVMKGDRERTLSVGCDGYI